MQTITPALAAILKDHFQAGAQGYRGRIRLGADVYYPTSISIDHSLQAFASQLTAVFTNEEGEVGLADDAFPENALFTCEQWFGDEANAVTTFTGFVDKVAEHRDARTVTLIARDWTKPLLVQDLLVTAPQAADEDGAVRTTANLVYLNMEISDIVADLLNKAGYPADQRSIQPTNFVVDEYLGRDGASYADAISELAEPVAFNAFADELGIFKFQPDGLADSTTDDPPEPVYTFRTGEDILALDPVRDDYDTKTRVRATGPYTTLKDAWTELWHTNVIKNPTGVRYEPGDPTHLYVADGPLRKIYYITQGADAAIVSSVDLSGVITYLNGLSGDPSDATVYWTFDTPWINGSAATNNKLRKHLKSDNSVVATFTLANQLWTDMKVGADAIWAMNFSTGKVHKLSKATGAESASYIVPGHTQPIGVAIDGTDLFEAFNGEAAFLQSTTADPTTIVRSLAFSGTKALGGDIDTDTHTELYACSGGLSLVYKYTLKEPVTNDVSVETINDDLEIALGAALDTGREIRRLRLDLKMITSYAQATEAAVRRLDKLDQYRNVLDVGITGNPALEKGDMIRIVDPVTLIDADFQIDTYRSLMADTYLGTMSLVPWTSSYAGPGDVPIYGPIATDGSWRTLNVKGVSPPAGWNEVGFDDSAWSFPANVVDMVPHGGHAFYRARGPVEQNVPDDEIILRKEFFIRADDLVGADVAFEYAMDNGGYIYVNGVEVASLLPLNDDTTTHYTTPHTTTIPRSAFQAGLNCVAVYVHNDHAGSIGATPPGPISGGCFIDLPILVL